MSFADKRTAARNQPVSPLSAVVKNAMEGTEEKKYHMVTQLPKALFLDLDDTILADSDPTDDCWLAAYQSLVDQLVGISYQQFLAAIHERRNWFWSDFDRGRRGRLDLSIARRHIAAEALQQLGVADSLAHEIEREYSAQREQRSQLFPGAIETLQWLRDQGIPLALLTNGAAQAQRKKIERWGLASFFDCIVVEGEFGSGKPDERVYLYALHRLSVQPEETWMVGDNLEWDIAAPQWLGIKGIWVNRTGDEVPRTHRIRPHRIIRTLADLRTQD